MKDTGRCPKCSSAALIVIDNTMGKQLTPVRIGPFTVASTARYICTDCGYMEEWLVNEKDLKKLRKKCK